MVEAFPEESPGREQNPRRIGWQCIEFRDQFRTLFFSIRPCSMNGSKLCSSSERLMFSR